MGCADCAGCVDCVGCSDGADCAVPGRVVCSVIEAGIGLLVAEVKLHPSVVMIVGVGLSAVRDM